MSDQAFREYSFVDKMIVPMFEYIWMEREEKVTKIRCRGADTFLPPFSVELTEEHPGNMTVMITGQGWETRNSFCSAYLEGEFDFVAPVTVHLLELMRDYPENWNNIPYYEKLWVSKDIPDLYCWSCRLPDVAVSADKWMNTGNGEAFSDAHPQHLEGWVKKYQDRKYDQEVGILYEWESDFLSFRSDAFSSIAIELTRELLNQGDKNA